MPIAARRRRSRSRGPGRGRGLRTGSLPGNPGARRERGSAAGARRAGRPAVTDRDRRAARRRRRRADLHHSDARAPGAAATAATGTAVATTTTIPTGPRFFRALARTEAACTTEATGAAVPAPSSCSTVSGRDRPGLHDDGRRVEVDPERAAAEAPAVAASSAAATASPAAASPVSVAVDDEVAGLPTAAAAAAAAVPGGARAAEPTVRAGPRGRGAGWGFTTAAPPNALCPAQAGCAASGVPAPGSRTRLRRRRASLHCPADRGGRCRRRPHRLRRSRPPTELGLSPPVPPLFPAPPSLSRRSCPSAPASRLPRWRRQRRRLRPLPERRRPP